VPGNLRLRLISALVAIPLLVLLVGWAPPLIFTGVFYLLIIASLKEYFTMAFPGRRWEQIWGISFGIAVSATLIWSDATATGLWLSVLLVLCFSFYLFLTGKLEERLMRLAWTLLGCFYLGFLLPHWVLLFRMPAGRAWVFFILIAIMAGDSVAYFVGQRFGRKKLAPEISPGKTIEGACGYVAGSVIAGGLAGAFLLPEVYWLETLLVALCLSILGQLGDLFESWLKRVFVVKDSSSLIPGHGGLLDRLDSLVFPAVFTTAYLKVFHS